MSIQQPSTFAQLRQKLGGVSGKEEVTSSTEATQGLLDPYFYIDEYLSSTIKNDPRTNFSFALRSVTKFEVKSVATSDTNIESLPSWWTTFDK